MIEPEEEFHIDNLPSQVETDNLVASGEKLNFPTTSIFYNLLF